MTDTKHTPGGEWRAEKFGDTKSHTLYAPGLEYSIGSVKHKDPDTQAANAKRICAAVNAIEGLDTSQLRPGAVKALLDAAKTAREYLEASPMPKGDNFKLHTYEGIHNAIAAFEEKS